MTRRATAAVTEPPVFHFDPSEHAYSLNGETIPSITQMLAQCGFIKDEFYTEEAAARGTLVHSLTAQFDLGAITAPQAIECIWKGFVLAHISAMQTLKPEILSVEVARCSLEHRFGGRPDRTLRLWGALGVLDLKTGGKEDWHGYQLALQSILVAPEFGLPPSAGQRHGLYLRANGKWTLVEYKGRRDFDTAHEVIKACARPAA